MIIRVIENKEKISFSVWLWLIIVIYYEIMVIKYNYSEYSYNKIFEFWILIIATHEKNFLCGYN